MKDMQETAVKSNSKFLSVISTIEQNTAVRAIRSGMVNMIPVLIIGAIALVFMFFPVDPYQTAIKSLWNGFFFEFFNLINKVQIYVFLVHWQRSA